MKIIPLGQRVVAEPVAAEKKTASGLIIPDGASEKSNKAKVVAISKELKTSDDNQISEGDTVLFKEFSAETINMDGKEYIILQAEDIMAIL
ncbi:MAG: co-chaperone GroES [Bacteroidota bacterium]|nr:co-chaperone GroES [Bacteroidota bacterium]